MREALLSRVLGLPEPRHSSLTWLLELLIIALPVSGNTEAHLFEYVLLHVAGRLLLTVVLSPHLASSRVDGSDGGLGMVPESQVSRIVGVHALLLLRGRVAAQSLVNVTRPCS